MPNRVEIVRSLIAQQRAAGISPIEMHMCAATRKEFAEEAGIKPARPDDSRSLWERMRVPNGAPEAVLSFEGVRLVDNEAIAGSGILLRPLQLMGDPEWLQTIQWASAQARLKAQADQGRTEADGATPWHQREPLPTPLSTREAIEGDQIDVLSVLTDGGGVNPTTVLLRAMDGLDKIEDVVVLRFYRGGSIDLCSTMKKYAVIGALQAALGHVANRDDD